MSLVEEYMAGSFNPDDCGGSAKEADLENAEAFDIVAKPRPVKKRPHFPIKDMAPEETRRHGTDRGKDKYLRTKREADAQIREWLAPEADVQAPAMSERQELHRFLTGFEGGVVAHVTRRSAKMRPAPVIGLGPSVDLDSI